MNKIEQKIRACKKQRAENNKVIKRLREERKSIMKKIYNIETANFVIEKQLNSLLDEYESII